MRCREGGAKLPYFHDSNVLIGYYFHSADNWGRAATSVFDDPERNYSSTFVWGECFGIESGGRCATIRKNIVREFRRAIATIKRVPSVDVLETEVVRWRIRGIILQAITEAGRDAVTTIGLLEQVKTCYEQECSQRLARLENPSVLSLHHRQTAYTELYHGLDAIDDPDDIEVVLDAHDLALSVSGLVFWTGDGAHIMQNRDMVLKMTGFGDVRYLGDVST
ncbi:MAG: Uncharacterized protein XD88_0134 [Methanocalculus sp. 52_23]|nr:MAG: Uncharacterized protein XD88_0134 [Methanocalculus sp. 52_23]